MAACASQAGRDKTLLRSTISKAHDEPVAELSYAKAVLIPGRSSCWQDSLHCLQH